MEHYEPIFAAAHCSLDTSTTQYKGHASDIASQLDVSLYDGLIVGSGDGLVHECINGLAQRSDYQEAFAHLPIAMIPFGSGNALANSIHDTTVPELAAINIIKGLSTPVNMCSITYGPSSLKRYSFLSQGFGWIATMDIGTDWLRWLGPIRFALGYVFACVIPMTSKKCNVALHVIESDKDVMRRQQTRPPHPLSHLTPSTLDLKYGTVQSPLPPSWRNLYYPKLRNLYVGTMPWMSNDAICFPMAGPHDGTIDLTIIQGTISRLRAIRFISLLPTGKHYDMPEVFYAKCDAYRVSTVDGKSHTLSIDGEAFHCSAFQVEVHHGLLRIFTESGSFRPVPL